MPRYKLTLEYDGSPYSGWQKQAHSLGIQEIFEAACSKFADASIETHVAGRTDAGVHARGQVVHVDFAKAPDTFKICEGLNALLLPHPISVLTAELVPDAFHARFDAKTRSYEYHIINRSSRLAIDEKRAWYIFRKLDLDAMREGAAHLIGHHDFTSFRDSHCQSKSPEKTLDSLTFQREGERVIMSTSARSFLHHQVRNIIGTLVHVGTGKWSPDDVKKALEAKSRSAAGLTAPAHGLYLMKVEY